MKHNTNTPNPAINDFNGFAGLLANMTKEHQFGSMTDFQIMQRHFVLLSSFMDKLDSIRKVEVNQTLIRLMSCYSKHSTDSFEIKNEVQDTIVGSNGICALYDILSNFQDQIDEWRADFENMLEIFDNNKNDE